MFVEIKVTGFSIGHITHLVLTDLLKNDLPPPHSPIYHNKI